MLHTHIEYTDTQVLQVKTSETGKNFAQNFASIQLPRSRHRDIYGLDIFQIRDYTSNSDF